MNETLLQVDYLKKITLEMESGTSPDEMNLCGKPVVFEFIYGVGSAGITNFEKAFFSKSIGDEIVYPVEGSTAGEHLGHLRQPIQDLLPETPRYFIKARITSIEQTDPHEVVKAIAAGAAGGCDCGCGCS